MMSLSDNYFGGVVQSNEAHLQNRMSVHAAQPPPRLLVSKDYQYYKLLCDWIIRKESKQIFIVEIVVSAG